MSKSILRCGVQGLAGACSVCYGARYADSVRCDSSSGIDERKKHDIQWAHPHPYDTAVPKERFVDVERYRHNKELWDLKGLVDLWVERDGQESWPWVWCWHNPVGPHHVFIGVSPHTLELTRKISNEHRNNNLTIIVNSMKDFEGYGKVEDYYKNRCAVIESPVAQMDTKDKVLMLEDERIICFDRAYIA
jgi:hypothetical protein